MITVWGRNNSTNTKKVLWTLEELGLPYEQVMAGMEYGKNTDAGFLALNPNGLVPLLQDGETDLILWESNAIVRYLAAQYGEGRLWPPVPAKRAIGDKWLDWANQTLAPVHRVLLTGLVRTPEEKRDHSTLYEKQLQCEELLLLMDEALADQPWFSGGQFGLGDIALAPFIWNLDHMGLPWQPRPNLERWKEQLAKRPAYEKIVMIEVS